MELQEYDEASNLRMLEGLPVRFRAAFAFLCALRLVPEYRRFHARTGRGDAQALEALAEELWRDVTMAHEMNQVELARAVDRCMALIPSEDEGWDEETQPYAEDGAAALAYALRARLTGDAQEAAWAGRRAYEALDHYVVRATGDAPTGADAERRILSHPAIQAELTRQRQYLQELAALGRHGNAASRLDELRRRAEMDAKAFFVVVRGD